MHREGHVGAALLAYAPLGALAVAAGSDDVAVFGAVAAVTLAMLPDVDMRMPFLEHRGPTHTVWFAAVCGLAAGALGAYAASPGGPLAALSLGAFTGVVASTTILSHVLADGLTPMGVRPFSPWSRRSYSLDLFPASNPLANYALLVAGGIAAAAGLSVGTWLRAVLA